MGDLRDPLEAERLLAHAPEAFHTRRDFLKRTAVTAGLAASMGLVLDPDTLVAEAARRQREVAIPSPRNLPIDTFVVLMMENRSFDHYLGWLPGADGRQAGLQFTDNQGHTFPTHRLQTDFQGCAFLDPDHSWAGGRAELDSGKMDGFLKADSDTFAIGYYTADDLPFTPHMAQAFTAFDRFFCSLLSSTYPNREYMHAGQSYGKVDNSMPSGNGFPDTTIFAALSNAGVSNRYYYTDIPVSALWGSAGLSRSSQVQTFYEQAAAGTLPALSFVDPSFNGEDQGTSGDEHPHGDVRVGQAFVADVVHAFMESPQFKRGALFVVYDEWGGFFDHVVPPRVPDLRTSTDLMQDFGQMGFRIPAVTVSPYARRGYVDHSVYGFESILKMIRYRYGLPPLTPRDLYANNIAAAFDFEHPNFTPPPLPTPPAVISAACSGSTPIDTGGAGLDGGTLLGTPLPGGLTRSEHTRRARQGHLAEPPQRAKPHDLQNLVSSGWLERLHFDYKPATPATMFRHPSSLGLRP
ncbi:MAG TPA: alkaline phosphatase family protein [Solirubrobacteraceae bacterium]|jgi:phospholipase C